MKQSVAYSNKNINFVHLENNSTCICPESSHLSHYGKSTIQSKVVVLHLKAVFKLLYNKSRRLHTDTNQRTVASSNEKASFKISCVGEFQSASVGTDEDDELVLCCSTCHGKQLLPAVLSSLDT